MVDLEEAFKEDRSVELGCLKAGQLDTFYLENARAFAAIFTRKGPDVVIRHENLPHVGGSSEDSKPLSGVHEGISAPLFSYEGDSVIDIVVLG